MYLCMGCSLIIAFAMVSQTDNSILSAAAVDFVGLIYLLIVAVSSVSNCHCVLKLNDEDWLCCIVRHLGLQQFFLHPFLF